MLCLGACLSLVWSCLLNHLRCECLLILVMIAVGCCLNLVIIGHTKMMVLLWFGTSFMCLGVLILLVLLWLLCNYSCLCFCCVLLLVGLRILLSF